MVLVVAAEGEAQPELELRGVLSFAIKGQHHPVAGMPPFKIHRVEAVCANALCGQRQADGAATFYHCVGADQGRFVLGTEDKRWQWKRLPVPAMKEARGVHVRTAKSEDIEAGF